MSTAWRPRTSRADVEGYRDDLRDLERRTGHDAKEVHALLQRMPQGGSTRAGVECLLMLATYLPLPDLRREAHHWLAMSILTANLKPEVETLSQALDAALIEAFDQRAGLAPQPRTPANPTPPSEGGPPCPDRPPTA